MNPEELAMMQQGEPMIQPEESGMPQTENPDGSITEEPSMIPEMEDPELAPEQMEMMGQDEMGMDMGMPQPTEMLSEVIMEYMDFVVGIKNDQQLDKQVQSKIMAEQAQAISSLVPLLTNNGEMELMKMRHEMDLKYQEHEMDMEMKKQEMEMKQQEQQMNLQFKAQESQVKLQTQEAQAHQKIVQSEESHKSKMEQQKQAAQSKQSSNPSSN